MNARDAMHRIDFASRPWTDGRDGVRFKSHREGTRQIRMVEFSTSEGDPHWCEIGHIGCVIKGGLEIEVGSKRLKFVAGDGLCLPPGPEAKHRAVSIIPGTVLFMIEEVER